MPRKRLDSMKEICRYLRKSANTVRRLRKMGLPVYSYKGKRGHVFAYEDELEKWLEKFAHF